MMLVSMNHAVLFKQKTEYITHIAREVWAYVFQNTMSKVVTEHGDKYNLTVNVFDWISVLSNEDMAGKAYNDKIHLYLTFVCGMLRGELMVLGLDCRVEPRRENDGYVFAITISKAP
eukprot:TRINITY_DN7731_c0_g1_i10.p1 TRINITY_DN7731_c0_g1~~TRINITY_DN7731_c0_g1_i10.p1  ORF type:complete len:117 (-),score=39.76 TRINITY_DN7731_c0_g1_i10:99-449(-)